MIVAALIHDLGDVLAPENHSQYAAAIIRPYVRDEVTWTVLMHGVFQLRYYGHHLDIDPEAREPYRDHPWYDTCDRFCERWDQASFDPDYPDAAARALRADGARDLRPPTVRPGNRPRTFARRQVACVAMRTSLADLLASRDVLLADGATGTNYFQRGLGSGYPPELWNFEHPERVVGLHQEFVDAGADIILTNTFGGTAQRLKLHDAQDRVFEISKRAAELARSVADAADRPVVVAGSVGPTGELFEPMGKLTEEVAIASFREQIRGLKDGGADVAWIETMSSAEEVRAAALAAIAEDMPYTATCSFDTAGRTMMGIMPDAMVNMFDGLDPQPLAFGANCGVGRQRHPGHGAVDLWWSARRRHQQGQLRHPAVPGHRDRLLGHARADGRVRRRWPPTPAPASSVAAVARHPSTSPACAVRSTPACRHLPRR